MVVVTRIADKAAFDDLREEWTVLLSQSPVNDAFLTWEWLSTWWKHYGHNYQLWLLTAWQDSALVGIAPLMLEQKRFLGYKLRILRNIGVPPPDVGGFIIRDSDRDVLVALLQYILGETKSWDALLLNEFPRITFDSNAFLEVFPKSLYAIDVQESQHFTVRVGKDWNTYQSSLSRNVRKSLRRRQRRLEEQGEVVFTHITGDKVTADHMQTIFDIHARSHHPEDYVSVSEQAFHRDLVRVLGAKGWLDVSFLFLSGQPIAYQYGFLYHQRASLWRSAFDTSYYRYSPGSVLLFRFIKDCFGRGVTMLDFLRGSHGFKRDWQVETLTFYHPRVVRRVLVPQLSFLWLPCLRKRTRMLLSRSAVMQEILRRYDSYRRAHWMTHLPGNPS